MNAIYSHATTVVFVLLSVILEAGHGKMRNEVFAEGERFSEIEVTLRDEKTFRRWSALRDMKKISAFVNWINAARPKDSEIRFNGRIPPASTKTSVEVILKTANGRTKKLTILGDTDIVLDSDVLFLCSERLKRESLLDLLGDDDDLAAKKRARTTKGRNQLREQ